MCQRSQGENLIREKITNRMYKISEGFLSHLYNLKKKCRKSLTNHTIDSKILSYNNTSYNISNVISHDIAKQFHNILQRGREKNIETKCLDVHKEVKMREYRELQMAMPVLEMMEGLRR